MKISRRETYNQGRHLPIPEIPALQIPHNQFRDVILREPDPILRRILIKLYMNFEENLLELLEFLMTILTFKRR